MTEKKDLWDQIEAAKGNLSGSAALIENGSTADEVKPAKTTKTLKAVPVDFVERHGKLKESGKTALNFSNYTYEALREKLMRDESKD